MKKALAIGLAAAGILTFSSTANAAHDRGSLTVGLNGANEMTVQGGDPDGSGKITLEFFDAVSNGGPQYVCYALTTRNIGEQVGLHIHEVSTSGNPRKASGPIRVDLLKDPKVNGNSMCVVVQETFFDGIQEDPSDYYVNVHTTALPMGAIRGQLHAFS